MSALASVLIESYKPRHYVPHVTCEAEGMGEESIIIAERCMALAHHYASPFSRFWASPIVKYETYRQQWEEETKFTSSTVEIVMNSSYQKIIGLGQKALPLILADLQKKPAHWFWALKSISGEDPVRPEQRGRVKKMTEAWIQWGKEKGLI